MSNIETLITSQIRTPSRNRNRHPLCYLIAYQISRYEALLHLFKPMRFEKLYKKNLDLLLCTPYLNTRPGTVYLDIF